MIEINKIHLGDNLKVLKKFPDNSVDSVVTDPPYGISFMNKHWDYDVPTVALWKEVMRVLKPGGHMLVACGTRTQHRMAVNIEDAGFEIRDIVAWIYGEGFPKSLDISKAIDKSMGLEREVVGKRTDGRYAHSFQETNNQMGQLNPKKSNVDKIGQITVPSSPQAKQYEGWGTALKPAMELWTLARKPFNTTVAENVLEYGTGGLNIDGCRVEFNGNIPKASGLGRNKDNHTSYSIPSLENKWENNSKGRFPANVMHDGSDEVVDLFPSEVARFFYCPKPSQSERNMGLYGFEETVTTDGRNKPIDNAFNRGKTQRRNIHPTVKPIELMRYLCRLITPKGGIVLDPYIGSGTTAIAAKQEKMAYIGIELMEEYKDIAEARIKATVVEFDIFDFMEEKEC